MSVHNQFSLNRTMKVLWRNMQTTPKNQLNQTAWNAISYDTFGSGLNKNKNEEAEASGCNEA
ncbi:MAG: hypothetical protein ABJN69_05950 [Hellea sp.]